MKSFRNLALAATLALIGMAGGYTGDARADTGTLATPAGKPVVTQGLLLPAIQKAPEDGAADLVTGAGAGKPGEAKALIGLLKPSESVPTDGTITDGTLPAVQIPTDQVNGAGRADLVTGTGGGQANGVTKVGPGTLVLSNQNTYAGQKGSLQRLGSINDLFANSRGGDQAAGAHGAGGGGGTGKASLHDNSVTKPGDGSVMPTDQIANPTDGGTQLPAVQKVREAANRATVNTANMPTDLAGKGAVPQGLLLPAIQSAREAARSSSGTSGGGQVAGNAVKGVAIQNTARK